MWIISLTAVFSIIILSVFCIVLASKMSQIPPRGVLISGAGLGGILFILGWALVYQTTIFGSAWGTFTNIEWWTLVGLSIGIIVLLLGIYIVLNSVSLKLDWQAKDFLEQSLNNRENLKKQENEQILNDKKHLLEMIVRGESLSDFLDKLVSSLEKHAPGVIGAIFIVDNTGKHLRVGSAPNLPIEFIEAIERNEIGKFAGCCGTAVNRQETVIIPDIAVDPLCKNFCDVALKNNLLACWSIPVFSKDGKVLGALAMYYNKVHVPTLQELQLLESITNIAGFALEILQEEINLIKSEARYRHLFNCIIDAVFVYHINARGEPARFIAVNESACKILEYDKEVLLKMSLPDIVCEKSSLENFKIGEEYVNVKRRTFETNLTTRTGESIPVEMNCHLFKLNGIKTVLSIAHNVSERKEAERVQRVLENELYKSQKLESLGVLAGGIAHDFNNILTAIMGNISLAKLNLDSQSTLFSRLDEAEKASLRAKSLTRQLLTFAKGGSPIKKAASITEIINETANFVLRGSPIKSEYFFREGLWPVEIDEGQMSQVINNLVVNSMQAMLKGGKIKIYGENFETFSGNHEYDFPIKKGKYVKLTFHDEGVGIPPESIPRIFDPYFTTKENGTGLGLATSYSIIKKHEGYIKVTSERFKGTDFIIFLPALPGANVSKESNDLIIEKGCGRILVMDDEQAVLEVSGQILNRLGYEVIFTVDGREAVEKYREEFLTGNPFDAVIMDLTVPGGLGGKETVTELLKFDPNLKAIVSSGYSNDPVMAQYLDYGFVERLCKPYNIHTMGTTLKRALLQPVEV